MSKDKLTGAALLVISVVIILAYNFVLWYPSLSKVASVFLLKLTDSIIVVVVLGILAYIGYTLYTTPPPKPIEEIEKELEKELKALTQSQKAQQEGGQAGSGPSASS